MRELEERFPDAVAIVGVHSGKYTAERDLSRIRDASIRLGATHPVLNDRQFRVWRSYAVRAWPTLVAIDPRGTVVGMQAGEFTADAVAPFLERLIADARADGTLREGREPLTPELPSQPPGLLDYPGKVALLGSRIAIADSGHHRVLLGSLDDSGATMRVERIIGSGMPGFDDGASPTFRNPQGVAFGDDALYVADAGNHAVRAISLHTGVVRTLAGTGRQLRRGADRVAGALSSPWDLVLAGSSLYVAMAGVHQLWQLDLASGRCAPWTGSGAEELHDGTHAEAALAQPMGLARSGEMLVVADAESSAVRVVDLAATGSVRTIVGTGLFDFGDVDAAGDAARLQHPQGVAVGADGRWLVCDSYNDSLRWLDHESRAITTWVRGLNEPGGLALNGRAAYVADTNAHRIAVVDLGTAEVQTLTIVS